MNPLLLVLSFAPWLAFGFLAGHSQESLTIAFLAAIVLTLLTGYRQLLKGYMLTVVTFLFFVIAFLIIVILQQFWVAGYLQFLSMAVLAATGWGSVIARFPFTLQYAREGVDPEHAKTPAFLRANYIITGAWCLVFSVNLLLALFLLVWPGVSGTEIYIITWLLIFAAIGFTLVYPVWLHKKAAQR
jgi:carotenoid cleavage dioxygenase